MNDAWDDDDRYTINTQRHDIRVLDGLRESTRMALRRQGIHAVHQLAALSVEDLQKFNGIGKVTAPAIKAHAQAWMEQRAVWYNPLRASCSQGGFMFDLETDGFTHVPWCFGWEDADGTAYAAVVSSEHRETSLTLPNGREILVVTSSAALWDLFAEMTAGSDCPVYHWGHYDKGILRSTAPANVREQLEDRMRNLHDTFKRAVKFPRRGTSLKETAAHLNFAWSSYQDWMAAYMDYGRWLSSGDIEALARACSYQQDDVRALGLVWRWLVDNAPEREDSSD